VALGATLILLLSMSPVTLAQGTAKNAPKVPVDVQILGLNDFHGQLEVVPPVVSSGGRIGALQGTAPNQTCNLPTCVPAGGAAYIATHVAQLRAANPKNTVFVSAGDLIGATPLLSAAFHDEPSIEAFNMMGLDYNGVGNHEFDEGITELLRMQFGNRSGFGYVPARQDGCHPVDGCGDDDGFKGAKFEFLAANVAYDEGPNIGDTIFPPYAIHTFKGGGKIAFIGMTLEGTPLIVSPGGISNVQFLDEAASVNALVPILKSQGVEAIVVLLHEGGVVGPGAGGPNTGGNPALINSCDNPQGALPPIVQAMDAEVDIVITGHTNWAINCLIGGKIVTGAGSQGRILTEIDAQLDPVTGDFVPNSIYVNNEIVTQNVRPDQKMLDLIAEYNEVVAPIANVIVGNVVGLMDRNARTAAGESTLGRLIADAQLASTAGIAQPGVIAFMNPGGIRANLDGEITHGEAFSVQPFSNIVTTKTMTGAQIRTVLEQQFTLNSLANPGVVGSTLRAVSARAILQVSNGFTYTWSESAAAGTKVSNMMLNGVAINPAASYRVTMNNFIGAGGDDLPAFTLGTNETTGQDDLLALEAYLGTHNPYTPDPVARITTVP
jgi:5'-nucleotidase